MVNSLEEKILQILPPHYEMSMSDLWRKAKYGNKNYLVKAVEKLEKGGYVTRKRIGKKTLVKRNSKLSEIENFILNYRKNLENYQKNIDQNIKKLGETMPIVPTNGSLFENLTIEEPVYELNEKTNKHSFKGKLQSRDVHTWRTRKEPLFYFGNILNLLSNIYQQSSAISFSEFIDDKPIIKEYQKESKEIIKNSLKTLDSIFEKFPETKFYANFYIQKTLYGLIHQIILDKELLDETSPTK
jgi:hypothetical protein